MIGLLLLIGLAATAAAPAARAAPGYSPPPGAWARFRSDLNAAQGLADGNGVTIALLSTGVDTKAPGLAGKATEGPDYIFKPRAALSGMFGTALAEFIVGAPGVVAGAAPGARILSLRTEPDGTEPGAQSFYSSSTVDEQQIEAQAIRYAADHGAKVILLDYSTADTPESLLQSTVNYALSKNVVIVAPAFAVSGSRSQYIYPEGFPGVIGVAPVMLPGGVAPQPEVSGQSDNSVLISGPSDQVAASGTEDLQSFGTAMGYVAATAALIKQRYPALSPALVARAIAMSARYHPSGGYSPSAGFGVLDPYAAPPAGGAAGGRRPRPFWIMISVLVLLGLGAAGGGAAGLVAIAGRHPTQAQLNAASDRELAVLWQRLSAGQIFPASVGYRSTLGAQTTARLVGIAPQAPCGSAVDARAAAVLRTAGCVTVLRATYADESGTTDLGLALINSLLSTFHVPVNPCTDKNVRC